MLNFGPGFTFMPPSKAGDVKGLGGVLLGLSVNSCKVDACVLIEDSNLCSGLIDAIDRPCPQVYLNKNSATATEATYWNTAVPTSVLPLSCIVEKRIDKR